MKHANLHLHSTYSDAQFTPAQLYLIGKSLGYKAIALTDHDTDGGVKELMDYSAKEGGMEVMVGSELTGLYEGINFHLVSLDYDMDNPALRAFIDERVEKRVESTRKCFEYGVENGIIEGLTWDDVLKVHGKGAWLCIDSVYNAFRLNGVPAPANLRARVFNAPETRQFKYKSAPAEKVIKLVRDAGGIVVMAHPYWCTPQWQEYLPALIDLGVNGIEVSHPDNLLNTSALALEAAKTYNLYHSGGTDHTGPMSGCGAANATPAIHGITEEEYMTIKERRLG